jgi:hypothetical protein
MLADNARKIRELCVTDRFSRQEYMLRSVRHRACDEPCEMNKCLSLVHPTTIDFGFLPKNHANE